MQRYFGLFSMHATTTVQVSGHIMYHYIVYIVCCQYVLRTIYMIFQIRQFLPIQDGKKEKRSDLGIIRKNGPNTWSLGWFSHLTDSIETTQPFRAMWLVSMTSADVHQLHTQIMGIRSQAPNQKGDNPQHQWMLNKALSGTTLYSTLLWGYLWGASWIPKQPQWWLGAFSDLNPIINWNSSGEWCDVTRMKPNLHTTNMTSVKRGQAEHLECWFTKFKYRPTGPTGVKVLACGRGG